MNGFTFKSSSSPFSWEPTEHSRICSLHFVSGAPAIGPKQLDYVPTILPEIYKNTQSERCLNRLMNRHF